MNREDKIRKLKDKIDLHIKNGGSVYDEKKDIPYYSYIIYFIYLCLSSCAFEKMKNFSRGSLTKNMHNCILTVDPFELKKGRISDV